MLAVAARPHVHGVWIGALKFAPYEADSISPFVANSPVMSFFYKHPTDYKAHLMREGELNPADRAWQTANDTYAFSHGLGTVEVAIGLRQPIVIIHAVML